MARSPPPSPPRAVTRPSSLWGRVRARVASMFRRHRTNIPMIPQPRHPPIDREMMAFDTVAATAVRRVVGGTLTMGRAAATFFACNPPAFDGQVHPTQVKDWLHRIVFILQICDIAQDEWVKLAASMLVGNARVFWEALTQQEVTAMTWDNFRERLLHQFLPQALPGEAKPSREFLTIPFPAAREFVLLAESVRMGDKESVVSYLSRMLTDVLAYNTLFDLTNDDRNQMLWRGLPESYRRHLIPLPGRPFFAYLEEVRQYEQVRYTVVQRPIRRTFPQAMRHDAEASTSRRQEAEPSDSRRRPRSTNEIEEEQLPPRRRQRYLDPIEEDSEEDPEEDPDEDPEEDPIEGE